MRGLCAVLALAAAPALAEGSFFSDAGDEYVAVFKAHGVVLTSAYPKAFARFEPWDDHRIERGPAVIAFGKACDALHSAFGKGRWAQANGGFVAEFARGGVWLCPAGTGAARGRLHLVALGQRCMARKPA